MQENYGCAGKPVSRLEKPGPDENQPEEEDVESIFFLNKRLIKGGYINQKVGQNVQRSFYNNNSRIKVYNNQAIISHASLYIRYVKKMFWEIYNENAR